MSYLPNSLNEFETYTYTMSLHMIRPEDISSVEQNILQGRSVLIADNAQETRYNITAVEQILVTGYYPMRSQMNSRFDMTITEPNGATLMNRLANAARELSIKVVQNARYILVIKFIGRTRTGASKVSSPIFYYPMFIGQVNFQIAGEGTTYQIAAQEEFTGGYLYLSQVVKDQLTVEAATMGEFVSELERKINLSGKRLLETDATKLFNDIYEFEWTEGTDDWRNWRFSQLDETLRVNGINVVGLGAEAKLQIPINNGSNISAVIGMALQLTEEYKKIPTDGLGQFMKEDGSSQPSTRKLDSFPAFYKVFPEIIYEQFDPIRGDYQKRIKFYISKFIVSDEVIDGAVYQSSITDTSVQSRRVQKLLSSGLMQKRYDYLYTGLNTEVLQLDLKFDRLYYQVTPIGGGILGDANPQTSVAGGDAISVIARLRDAKKQVAELSTELQAKQRALKARQRSTISGPQDVIDQRRDTDALLTGISILDRQLGPARRQLNTSVSGLLELYDLNSDDIAHQLHFASDVINDADAAGPESDLNGGAFQFGAVRTNLENTSDLLTIEMQIRGDPYWLGMPRNYVLENTGGAFDINQELADFQLGGQCFFLKVNLPTSDEDAGGRRKPQPDYQLSGVYRVADVISTYQNGQFTQYLKANLDTATNTPSAFAALDGDTGGGQFENGIRRDQNLLRDPASIQEDPRGERRP
mgnify:CR=1 FL=1|jgi:hypothetical protein